MGPQHERAPGRAPASDGDVAKGALTARPADRSSRRAVSPPTTLLVGAGDDPAEREADRVADLVVASLTDRGLTSTGRAPANRIRRSEALSRPVVGPAGGPVDEVLEGRIRRAAGRGSALDESTRGAMEAAFGADLSRVRLHADAESRSLNAALGARAFTYGRDVHLGDGLPDPGSVDGTRVLAHELAHVLQADGPIRRLVDRAALVALAGAPKSVGPLIKRSTEYRKILDLLDHYHAEGQRLWQADTPPRELRAALEPVIDQLVTACWAYVEEQPDSPRAPHIRNVITNEIPPERARLRAIEGGVAVDRARPLAEVGAGRPATVTAIGVEVGTAQVWDKAEEGIAEGHQMNVWFDIDAGATPAAPVGAPANSVHGVTIEYWEQVEVAYNFVEADAKKARRLKVAGEGKTTKQWNDILMMQRDSPTWSKTGGSIEQSWTAAVAAAATGGLTGKKRVGFQDNPGVTPKPGKHISRTLRFRVVVKDAHGQQEIHATQVIICDGRPTPKSMTYVDSRGVKVGRERAGNALRDMGDDDARLQAHAVTPAVLGASVPPLARAAVRTFVRQLLEGGAAAFVNSELTEITRHFAANPEGPHKVYGRMGKLKYGTADDYYEIAGINGLPYPQSGWVFHQYPLVGGALLVAIMEGSTIRRVYYTPSVLRTVGALAIPVRSFAEIPIEEVTAYVPSEQAYLKLSTSERADHDQVAHDETVATAGRAARAVGPIASAIRRGRRATLAYLARHMADYDQIEHEFDRIKAPATLAATLKASFAATIALKGAVIGTYLELSRKYPNEKALAILHGAFLDELVARGAANRNVADNAFVAMLGANRAQVGAAPAFVQIAQANHTDPARLKQLVVAHLEQNRGKFPDAEADYNTAVPPLGLPNVPPTLGEIVNEHFVAELGRVGGGMPAYVQLRDRFPAFEFRLRPAYRFLFGDVALTSLTERLRASKAAADVPDPGSQANQAAKQAFRAHGLYSQANFASSIAAAAKFDVGYDPATAELKVVVKLKFEFLDSTTPVAAKVKRREVGPKYEKTAWTDPAKDDFKAEFRRQVLGLWNANAPMIRCTRPGWEDLVARPVFEIQEVVAGGGEHNIVRTQKAVLQDTNKPGTKALKGGAASGWASAVTSLNEFDVADKMSDPDVHRYLHHIEKKQHVVPAYTTDHKQLSQRLDRFGRLEFNAGSGTALTEPGRLPILAEEILRLGLPPELAHLHAIEVVGDAIGGNVELGRTRADTVVAGLERLGIKNALKRVAGAQGVDAVVVRAAAPDPAVADTYVTKWSRITAAHEFGHMLGLMDEYYGAKSADVVKKMISDGLLPPSTRSDHLVAHPPANAMDEAPGQTSTMKLLEQANLATPDFTLGDGAKSTSLMTGGYELWPQHYLTVWEALTKLTAGDIEARYWKLG